MAIFLLGEEVALVLQDLDDERVGLENVLAGQFRHAACGGEAAAVIDGREDFEAVFLAELIIVLAVARRDVDEAGTGFGGDEVGGEDLTLAVVL